MKPSSPPPKGLEFESPADSPLAAITEGPDPNARFTSALYRTAARRAMHWLRAHLQGCPHIQLWMVTLDLEANPTSSFCLAKGGLHRIPITFSELLVRARPLAPAGIVLLQNRPGTIYEGTPIDLALSLHVALLCELHGIPLIDYIYSIPRAIRTSFANKAISQGRGAPSAAARSPRPRGLRQP
jgi:RadC-like JAB domain